MARSNHSPAGPHSPGICGLPPPPPAPALARGGVYTAGGLDHLHGAHNGAPVQCIWAPTLPMQ